MKKSYYSELSNQHLYTLFFSRSEKRNNVFRKHFHTETELGFMLKGEGAYVLGEKSFKAEKEKLFIIRSNEQHCLPTIVSDKLISLNMYLSPYFLWNECADYIPAQKINALINSQISIENCVQSEKISKCYKRIIPLFESDEEEARFKLRHEILTLLVLITDGIKANVMPEISPASRFGDIQSSISFMKENYSRQISLEDIAKSAAMSRTYFSATFKSVTGMAPYNYLSKIRISKAIELIKETDMNIMDIALACGFTSITTFNKAFKTLVGFPPTELRQKQ